MQFELLYENRAFFKMVMSYLRGKETRKYELRNKLKNEKDDIKVNIFNCRNLFSFKDNLSLHRKLKC